MISTPVSDKDLIKAIELRISNCFGAMMIANAMGGSPSIPWTLVSRYSLDELVADALDRGIDVRSIKSIDETPFMETKYYLKLRDLIGGRPDFPK